jgi:hypothetical protein
LILLARDCKISQSARIKLGIFAELRMCNPFKCSLLFATLLACAGVSDPTLGAVVQSEHLKLIFPQSASNPTNTYQLDVNGDGTNDLSFSYSAILHAGMIFGPSDSSAGGLNGAQLATTSTGGPGVTHFGPGQLIGPASSFSPAGRITLDLSIGTTGTWGSSNGPHFLGLRFPVGGEDHYGWVQFSHDPSPGINPQTGFPNAGPLIISSIAFETLANTPITTAPEPATLTLLGALVAVAFPRRRG